MKIELDLTEDEIKMLKKLTTTGGNRAAVCRPVHDSVYSKICKAIKLEKENQEPVKFLGFSGPLMIFLIIHY